MTTPLTTTYRSWGRCFDYAHHVHQLRWPSDDLSHLAADNGSVLPYGFGRSYGDSCLNDGGTLLHTAGLNRFAAFDPDTGVLRCEAGVSLAQLLELVVPRGWFLPVSPGTKFVSVGGAVANDVHGKNHHVAGTFGRHVRQFELLRSDGSRRTCSPTENPDFFRATVGGLGLTGLIPWVELQLRQIPSPMIDVETIKFDTVDEFFALSEESDRDFEYTMSWLDCLARGRAAGRGLFARGNHAAAGSANGTAAAAPKAHGLLRVPFDLPSAVLNSWSMRTFNQVVYHAGQRQKRVQRHLSYDTFYYPLDAIHDWNRIYGKRGFFQHQFVLPTEQRDALDRILQLIADSGNGSFLVVFKKFGEVESPGMLSFPMPGVTLALDFPNRGDATRALLDRLDEIVVTHGGRVYPAKDARMSPETFNASFPHWHEFAEYVDPKFSSSFWRRVTAA